LDADGRPQFYDLLRRWGLPIFYAFDVLWLRGDDVRIGPLIERKRPLRSSWISSRRRCFARAIIEGNRLLSARLQDLEGIVAKLKHGHYGEGWFKIRNARYSQYERRRELFEEKRGSGGELQFPGETFVAGTGRLPRTSPISWPTLRTKPKMRFPGRCSSDDNVLYHSRFGLASCERSVTHPE